jgi:hypothetical protein
VQRQGGGDHVEKPGNKYKATSSHGQSQLMRIPEDCILD